MQHAPTCAVELVRHLLAERAHVGTRAVPRPDRLCPTTPPCPITAVAGLIRFGLCGFAALLHAPLGGDLLVCLLLRDADQYAQNSPSVSPHREIVRAGLRVRLSGVVRPEFRRAHHAEASARGAPRVPGGASGSWNGLKSARVGGGWTAFVRGCLTYERASSPLA